MTDHITKEITNLKVTPTVTQDCVIEFDQNHIDIFSSIVVFNDSKSEESLIVCAEFEHSGLTDKTWNIPSDQFGESHSFKLTDLSVPISNSLHSNTERIETKGTFRASLGNREFFSQEFRFSLIPAVELQLGYSEVYSYVFNQNHFPLINLLEITNNSRTALRAIEIKATFDPADFNDVLWNIDELHSKHSLQLDEQRVEIPISNLDELVEEKKYNLRIQVTTKGKLVSTLKKPLRMLPKNQWGGESHMPELLASFVCPNGEYTDYLLKKAANSLATTDYGSQLDGYRSKTREKPYAIGAHLWSVIYDEGITYTYPPASFAKSGQKIRLQDDINQSRQATCLDSALLFAGCLEQAGLNVVLVFTEGHAMVGYWLIDKTLTGLTSNDPVDLRNRVAMKDVIIFETTFITSDSRITFGQAIEEGARKISEENEDNFIYVLDLKQARTREIKPLQMSKSGTGLKAEATKRESIPIPPVPALPPVDVFKEAEPTTPDGRVELWQRRLLDLSKRNKLLNIRGNSSGLKIVCPDIGMLEDALADGQKYNVVSLRSGPLATGQRNAKLFNNQTGQNINQTFVQNQMQNKNLVADCSDADLDKHLIQMFRKTKTDFEEGGSNTLFLALGVLRWKESETSDKSYRAPIILMPVRLERKSARTKPKLLQIPDEDTVFNPTLIEFLKKEFEIDLSLYEKQLPKDDSGVDVEGIWQTVREKIQGTHGFEVVEELFLSNFSFAKYLMWRDLRDRLEQLRSSTLVDHLIEKPQVAYPIQSDFIKPNEIDTKVHASELFAPLNADSSQIAAIEASTRNIDFVLEGPPGTGKTETIGNIIAHNLALGKKVLFIAEKMVALQQVYRRLNKVGLGHLCLELHSSKSSKKEVLKQLDEAWQVREMHTAIEWKDKANELEEHKNKLNAYVECLHEDSVFGISPYGAIARSVYHGETTALKLTWSQRNGIQEAPVKNKEELDQLLEKAENAGLDFKEIAGLDLDSLSLISNPEWSNIWQQDVLDSASRLLSSTSSISNSLDDLFEQLSPNEDFSKKLGSVTTWSNFAEGYLLAVEKKTDFALSADAENLITNLDDLAVAKKALDESLATFGTKPDQGLLKTLPISDWKSQMTQLENENRLADRYDYIDQILAYLKANNLPIDISLDQGLNDRCSSLNNNNKSVKRELKLKLSNNQILRLPHASWEQSFLSIAKSGATVFQKYEKLRKDILSSGLLNASDFTTATLSQDSLSTLQNSFQRNKQATGCSLIYSEMAKLPVDRWIAEYSSSKEKNFLTKFLVSRKIKKEMESCGLTKPKNFDILQEYKVMISNLLRIERQGLEYVISKTKELQSSIIEEQYIHFESLLNIYHQAQLQLLDLEEKAKPYLGDNVLDNTDCDSDHILARKKDAKLIRESMMLACSEVSDPSSMMRIIRQELIEKREFIASSTIVSKLNAFKEKASSFKENLDDFTQKAHYASDSETSLSDLLNKMQDLLKCAPGIRAWCQWQRSKNELISAGISEVVSALEQKLISPDSVKEDLLTAFCVWLSKPLMDSHESLRQFSSARHDKLIQEFREMDKAVADTTGQYIASILASSIPETKGPNAPHEFGVLSREIQKKTRHIPVRQLIEEMGENLLSLTPCFMMSPLSVAQFLPADYKAFDLVVFDEASQITVWDSVGAVARGRNVIVVGDPKQMPPTNFFNKTYQNQQSDEDLESILDQSMAASMPHHRLTGHYRSKHESLILFSNSRYYNNSLLTYPSSSTKDSAVSLHRVNGVYSKGKERNNPIEAQAVVKEVVRRLKDEELSKLSIGIVALNGEQMQLIENLLDDERRKNPFLDRFFDDHRTKEPIFIKNLETVQGDQRDVIILSIGYGPTEQGANTMSMNFGPLNKDGGERRLNVAITRAAREMLVFTSFDPSMIDLSRTSSTAIKDLKAYIDYARRGPAAIVEEARYNPGRDTFDSDFERSVANKLRKKGWKVRTQVGVSKFRIDLGVVNPDAPGVFLAGIECDGASYHSSPTARDRDRVRQVILEGLGWKLLRIWSTDYFIDPVRIINEIDRQLNEFLEDYRIAQTQDKAEQEEEEEPLETENENNNEDEIIESSNLDSDDQPPQTSQPRKIDASPYIHYSGPKCTDPHFCNESEVRERLVDIIEQEGPMFVEVAYKTYLQSAGIQKLGRQIRKLLNKNLEWILSSGLVEKNQELDKEGFLGFVVRSSESPEAVIRAKGPRELEDIPPSEIRLLANQMFGENFRKDNEVYKKILSFYGISKLTTKSKEILDTALLKN
jgi:very-short-patch-repair endonuclease